MALQNPVGELLDLVAVSAFYTGLLQEKLQHKVPLPLESKRDPGVGRVQHSVQTLRRWIALLDMAIAPALLRDALKTGMPQEVAQALMRHYVLKTSHTEHDRDKADCVCTHLYRHPRVDAAHELSRVPESHNGYARIAQVVLEYEAEIYRVLGEVDLPALQEEHVNLLREFEFLYQEIADFRTFDQLMDSGIIQRVRDMKQSFANGFYHPDVLANVAVYNTLFGARFDQLFRSTTEQIKNFAHKVQQDGASIMSRIEDDITVKHLADVKEEHVLNQEYGRAQENFRKISKFKKAVDRRRPHAAAAAASPTPPPALHTSAPAPIPQEPAAKAEQKPGATAKADSTPAAYTPPKAVTNSIEEGKFRSQLESIQTFLRAAEANASIVPLTRGVLHITNAEAEALRANFGQEKSFRADYNAVIAHIVALHARVLVEMSEFKEKQGSSYLWKPHADSLAYVLHTSVATFEQANKVLEVATKRGLAEKIAAMKGTIGKLNEQLQTVAKTLQQLSGSPTNS